MRRTLACLLMLAAGCARHARPEDATAKVAAPAAAPEPVPEDTPRYEHIFMMPVERALAEATKLLKDEGWVLQPTEDPKYLLTEWRTAELGRSGWGYRSDGDSLRYLVAGEPLAERQSIVRIFRMKRTAFSNDAEIRYEARTGALANKSMEMEFLEQRLRERAAPRTATNSNLDTVAWAEGNNYVQAMAPWTTTEGVVQGTRDLDLERELTFRLESRPSLETLMGTLRLTRDDSFARDPSFYLKRWRQEVQEPCAQKVAGFQPLLRAGLTVLIGEQLGTRESPAAVGDLACEAAEAGHAVTVALSISSTEQKRLDAYLASRGAPPDQDALLSGDFWRKLQQDGRGSRAMMDLIDRARALRAAGRTVTVVAFDTDMSSGTARDEKMAALLVKQRTARPNDVFLVLAGNVHTRLEEGSWSDDFVPMSLHLSKTDPGLKVLELAYAQGRRWGCELLPDNAIECNVIGTTPSPQVAIRPEQPRGIRMLEELDDGIHGFLDVGVLSPSLPAIALRGHEPPPAPPAKPGGPGATEVLYKPATPATTLQPPAPTGSTPPAAAPSPPAAPAPR